MANWIQRPDWIAHWQFEEPILIKWLRGLQKPVGVMASNDACGREVLQACARAGLQVPDEVAVLGVDNDEMMCELSSPPLSSVALDLDKAGYLAADLLSSLMSGQSRQSNTVIIRPNHIAVRRSSDVIVQEDPLVARALAYIREHDKQNLSVSHVTEEVGVSRRTRERRFSRAVGRTVLSEIMRCHLARAKSLLLETDLPITASRLSRALAV